MLNFEYSRFYLPHKIVHLFYFIIGGTVRLAKLVGPSLAKELIFTGRVLKAFDAEKIGLINYAVEQNNYGNAAYLKSLELAEEILTSGPIALRCAKMSINKSIEVIFLYVITR